LALALLWLVVRLPNLDSELGLQMDAASAGVAWFIAESWDKEPSRRYYAPVDQRDQWLELESGQLKPYLHVPPLGLWPLGLWIKAFGMGPTALRGAAIFFSLLLLLFSWLWMRQGFGEPLAMGALLLLALSPHSMHYSRNVDPMISHAFWLPLMAWLYGRYLARQTPARLYVWLGVSSLAMLSYWVSFGVYAALCSLHLWFRPRTAKRQIFLAVLTPMLVALLIWFYNVVVSGGWQTFWGDWEYTLRTRTQVDDVSWWSFLTLEWQRRFRNEGVVLVGSASVVFLWTLIKPDKARLVLLGLFAGALLFPYWVRRATLVHEYFTIWSLPVMAMAASWGLARLWRFSPIVLVLLLSLSLSQSLWVGFNRMVRYDRDYLLARRAGEAYDDHVHALGRGPVLLTDIRDNLHSLQYSSHANIMIVVDDKSGLEQALGAYDRSGRDEGLLFLTIAADQVLDAIPELSDYPQQKLTGEFDLELTESHWQTKFLEKAIDPVRRDGFSIYRLR
jgi:hypothetical protein